MVEDNKDSRINRIDQRVSILSDKILFVENRLDNITKWIDRFSGFDRECDAGCQDSCAAGCEGGCQGCQSCEGKEFGCSFEAFEPCGSGMTVEVPVDWWNYVISPLVSAILPDSNKVITGEPIESNVRIESDKIIVLPNSDLTIEMKDGSVARAKSISSSFIKLYSPVEAFLKVHDIERTDKIIGGKLIMSEGIYKKGIGITIPKGAEALILFRGTAYTGITEEEVVIGMNMLGLKPGSIGITRITK